MTTIDEADQQTVQNAENTDDNPDAKGPAEEELTPQQKAAKTRAKKKAEKENAPDPADLLPADLRTDSLTKSGGGAHDKDPIVHLYDFENGYGAKVYQRERGAEWEWAPLRDGSVVRHGIPGLGRVPAAGTIEAINDGLELVAALDG